MYILNTVICNKQNNEIYPQVISMGLDYNWNADDSVTKITANIPLPSVPRFDSFHLDPETRITDVISQSYIYTSGLLVSEAMINALRNFLLQPNTAYVATVIYDEAVLKYRWLHITQEIESSLDFGKSEFALEDGQKHFTPIAIVDREDLRVKCRNLIGTSGGEIVARKLHFLGRTPPYDLFVLQLTTRYIFVSERLASILRSGKFTGFEIQPTSVSVTFNTEPVPAG